MWRIFWAVALVVIGMILLLVNFDIMPVSIWNYLIPAFVVMLGIFLLVGWRGGARAPVHESVPLEGAARGLISLKHGAVPLKITSGTDQNTLFNGTFHGGVEKKVSHVQDMLMVELRTPSNVWEEYGWHLARRLESELAIAPSIPLALQYEGGAAETRMDLSGVQLTNLDIHTGASSIDVVLPNPSGTVRVTVDAGAASVKFRLPPQAAASIRGKMDPGSTQVDQSRFPNHGGGTYQSDDYESARDRIQVTIKGGLGSVEIR